MDAPEVTKALIDYVPQAIFPATIISLLFYFTWLDVEKFNKDE